MVPSDHVLGIYSPVILWRFPVITCPPPADFGLCIGKSLVVSGNNLSATKDFLVLLALTLPSSFRKVSEDSILEVLVIEGVEVVVVLILVIAAGA